MASIWTKKIPTVWAVAGVALFYGWIECHPLPWAPEMIRGNVEGCYAGFTSGNEDSCNSKTDFRRAEEAYGRLKSYRIVSIGRGIRNSDWTVTVDAERASGRTRETLDVFAAYLQRREERVTSIRSLDVTPQ